MLELSVFADGYVEVHSDFGEISEVMLSCEREIGKLQKNLQGVRS
jgi:hypothetical protein